MASSVKYFEEEESEIETLRDVHSSLVDLYLQVKFRNPNESNSVSEEQLEEEKAALASLSDYVLIDYVRNSFDILMNMKASEIGHPKLQRT